MTRRCERRTLMAVLLILGAGMLQGCADDPHTRTYGPYPGSGGYHGTPVNARGGEGGGNGGGGMM
jgi:hypothetical protein